MLKLRKIAVTGGLSCGKSTVCQILKDLGAYVVSADEIVHQLLSSDSTLSQDVVTLLGKDVLVNGKIDRARIAECVFMSPDLLQKLENLLHPAVYREIENEYQKQEQEDPSPTLFIAEIPLLFETGAEKNYNKTIAVVADPTLCLQRFMTATEYDREQYQQRMERQLPQRQKALLADYVIMNSGTMAQLQDTLKELYQELTNL